MGSLDNQQQQPSPVNAVSEYKDAWLRILLDHVGNDEYAHKAMQLAELNGLFDPILINAQRTPNAWCQPMDQGKHTERTFLLYFEDADKGIATYTDEAEARRAFEQATLTWNCYLFGALPLSSPESEVTDEMLAISGLNKDWNKLYVLLGELYEWCRGCNDFRVDSNLARRVQNALSPARPAIPSPKCGDGA